MRPAVVASEAPSFQKNRVARRFARNDVVWTFVFALGYFLISPPLFNYDGYTYRLQGLAPLQNMNQTHLIWIPFQWLLWQLSYLFHSASPRFFQVVSIIILALVYIRSFRLWSRLSRSAGTAAVLTLFAACSPPVWYLGSQNEPYPLLFLCVISCLRFPRRAAFWLTLATLLHQAAALLCLGYAVMLVWTGEDSWRARSKRAVLWLSAVGVFVAGSYSLVAYLKGIHSLPEFWNWLIGYLHTQHHLQGHWYEDLAKSIVGIIYMLLPLRPHEEALYAHFNDAQIRVGLIALSGIFALTAAGLWRRPRVRRAIRSLPWRAEPVVGTSLALIIAWAAFAIFWEPTNYYWAVALFPLLTLAARALRAFAFGRLPVLAALVLVSGWNLRADLRQDALNAQRFPDPQLRLIRARVDKNDLLLFLKQSWHDGVDYDLLGRCLTLEGYHVEYVLDHYVIRNPTGWRFPLNARLQRAFAEHQRVFVSQWVLRPDLYRDLANSYFLSSYVMEKYRPIAGPSLFKEVNDFFKNRKMQPSNARLGNDVLEHIIPANHPSLRAKRNNPA